MTPQLVVIADGSALQGTRRDRGISRYVAEFLARISHYPEVLLRILVHPDLFPPDLSSELSIYWRSSADIEEELSGLVGTPATYLICSPFQTEVHGSELLPRWIAERGMHVSAILYDLIPHMMSDVYLDSKAIFRSYYSRLSLVLTADDVYCDSASARTDLVRDFAVPTERVHVIGAGVNLEVFSRERAKKASASNRDFCSSLLLEDRKIVSYIAGEDERKNVRGLIVAWSLLPLATRSAARLILVCAVSDATRKTWEDLAIACGLSQSEFVITGLISEEELLAVYGISTLHVMPSLYEGFGLPVAEAAACDVPSICGNNSSLPEVLGENGVYFDSADPISIARCIDLILSNDQELSRLQSVARDRRALLSWDGPCQKFIDQVTKRAVSIREIKTSGNRLNVLLPPIRWGGPLIRQSISDLHTDKVEFFDCSSRRDRCFARPFSIDPMTSDRTVRTIQANRSDMTLVFVARSIDFAANIDVALRTNAVIYLLDSPPLDADDYSPVFKAWAEERVKSSAQARSTHLTSDIDVTAQTDFEAMGLSLIDDLIATASSVIVESRDQVELIRKISNFTSINIEMLPLPRAFRRRVHGATDATATDLIAESDPGWTEWSERLTEIVLRCHTR